MLTNHHVALGQLQKVSTPQKNYVSDGFYAKTLADEFPAEGMELVVLQEISDVTDRVKAAVKAAPPEKAFEARRGEIAKSVCHSQHKKDCGVYPD